MSEHFVPTHSQENNEPESPLLDSRDQKILMFVNREGPVNTRYFIDEGGFNYSTNKPHLDKLVALGLLRLDKKKRFHLTSRAGPLMFPDWNEMTLWEQWQVTDFDNLLDLGIAFQVLEVLKRVQLRKQAPSDGVAPLPWDSEPVRKVIDLVNKLDPDVPEEREKGRLFLNLLVYRQVILPSLGPSELLDDKSIKEYSDEPGPTVLDRISDWFDGISDGLYAISERLRGIPDSLLDWI